MKATFGAGCFWHVEEEFRKLKGVLKTEVGYMGGKTKCPSYEDVCTDKTGHVEVVHLEYDPKSVSYAQLLDLFWKVHDPTQLNRQGPDVGTQYKSVIFYHNEAQKDIAMKSKEEEQIMRQKLKPNSKLATEIISASTFYRAEEYHQKYLHKKGAKTCRIF